MQAILMEVGNWSLCFMSAWTVGNVEAPAKANIIEAKALKVPSTVEFECVAYKLRKT
jgi:hypothetical protein